MKKVFYLFMILAISSVLFSCGKDKQPTGGPEDKTPPEVIDIEPDNATTNFQSEEIVITFTETIDEGSFEDGLTIYPPILKKKITSGKQTVTIQFREALREDQTYLLTVDRRCKDLRDNSLDKAYSYVFSTSDSINSKRLDVDLKLDERAPKRQGIFYVELYNTEDTLFITSQNAEELKKFTFENIPSHKVNVLAFLDENRNLEADKTKELFQQKVVNLDNEYSLVTLTLTLQDSTSPVLKNIVPESVQMLTLNFSEDIKDIQSIVIIDTVTQKKIPVYEYMINGSYIECVTGILDTNTCLLKLKDITDFKNNSTILDTMLFMNRQQADTTWLELDSLSHEDGQTVTTLTPEFSIRFNKIIPEDNLSIMLVNSENNQPVGLAIEKEDGYTFVVKPKELLKNYVPYSLIISEDTADYEGNTLKEAVEISILPLLYN